MQNLGRYRPDLQAWAQAGGVPMDFVGTQRTGPSGWDNDHEGHAGYRISQLLNGAGGDGTDGNGHPDGLAVWLAKLAAKGQTPHVVLLMIGTNDILAGQAARAAAIGNLGALLDGLIGRLPVARIVVASIPPMTYSNPVWNGYVQAYNAELAALVANKAATGKLVEFIDVYARLNAGDVSSDHVHLLSSGYEKTADAWADAWLSAIPEPAAMTLLVLAGLLMRLKRG